MFESLLKNILALVLAVVFTAAALAQTPVSVLDRMPPADAIFVDMAVTAASAAKARGQKPSGAVIIVNRVWKATGTASPGVSAEEDAVRKSRLADFSGAVVYTVNQPVAAACAFLAEAGIPRVVFVNPAELVVKAGLHTAADYDGSSAWPFALVQVPYFEATSLLNE